ncbi:hypothetical protein SAMN02800687_1791 [Curtobacterium sp. UNCCL20]|uniref:hypothetical protein n=1 Tax=Curtobacterium sp. UNCCL20 TaxID=1502773 RepID=UPI000881F870|nr:hypothetical protein [Curtobacterium sp. UNCCL20]SDQ41514.1 hypothetical protein SAMN02800687_1791 [Curtobacterium sp. UNCCL20]
MNSSRNGRRTRTTSALVTVGGLVVAAVTGAGVWFGHEQGGTTDSSTSTESSTSTGTSSDTGSSSDSSTSSDQGVSSGNSSSTGSSDATTTGS